jgi:hypothetical protein
MSTLQNETTGNAAMLHVFDQDGGWHWGITVPRENGCGSRVVAFSERSFAHECDAAADGSRTLDAINAQSRPRTSGAI